ncbi:hypothetical protein XPA_009693 [Xanthoria parietina]
MPEPAEPNPHSASSRTVPYQSLVDEEEVGTWPKPQNEEEWTLRDVFERKEWDKEDGTRTTGQIHLRYEYDIGDGWGHTIFLLGLAEKGLHQVLAGREDNVPSSLCFGGQGHPCAEDCGDEWYQTVYATEDPNGLDPYKRDIPEVNDGPTDVEV